MATPIRWLRPPGSFACRAATPAPDGFNRPPAPGPSVGDAAEEAAPQTKTKTRYTHISLAHHLVVRDAPNQLATGWAHCVLEMWPKREHDTRM